MTRANVVRGNCVWCQDGTKLAVRALAWPVIITAGHYPDLELSGLLQFGQKMGATEA